MSDILNSSPIVQNVAIATDFSPCSDRATQHALAVADRFGACLHFLHTIRRSEFSLVPEFMVRLDELAKRDCEGMLVRLNATHSLDDIEHNCWNLDGEVQDTIGSFVQDRNIDLLVLGTRGRGAVARIFLGSVAEQIFRCVSCPVLTVGPWSRGASRQLQMKKVLLATDLSTDSIAAIPYVLTAAKTWRTEIDVLHVCSSTECDCRQSMERFSHKIDSLAKAENDVSVRYHVRVGRASKVVLDFAMQNREDLIVLGLEHHRSLYGGPPLSHAYEIVRRAPCPVLSVQVAKRRDRRHEEELQEIGSIPR